MKSPTNFRYSQRGVAAILFVTILFMSLLIVAAMARWIDIQRRGDTQMRVATKDILVAQMAIQDMRLRLIQGTLSNACNGAAQTYSYSLGNGYTVTVSLNCNP